MEGRKLEPCFFFIHWRLGDRKSAFITFQILFELIVLDSIHKLTGNP